jgi:multidrug efflux pump subunit AcrA (membrane-fusion protein)
MARVVVTVSGPDAISGKEENLLSSLLPGMFVEVHLYGKDLPGVITVPRGVLHDNDTLWIVDENNRLHIRSVEIIRRERDEVLVSSGVAAGEKIVLTNLSGAAEGMLLRPLVPEARQ